MSLKDKVSLSVVAFTIILGLCIFSLSVIESRKVPAWIFAYNVPYNETLTRLDLIELEEQDISRFHGLVEALRRSDPLSPVRIPHRKGKMIVDLLGGEDTDVARARVRNVVYCYSIELEGNYYKVCIIFLEDSKRAILTGAYWVAGI